MSLEKLLLNDSDEMFLDKKQIFIVDDDISVCRSLKILMISYGFAVETFSSAEEYFKDVPNTSKGCLILDIHMPGFNGWDVMKRLTKTGYNLPVIVISADKDDKLEKKALKAGAAGFLQKPFEDHYLLHMVTRIFDKTEGHKNDMRESKV